MSASMTRRGTFAVLAAIVSLLATLATASQAGAATYYACVKKKSGSAHVYTTKPKCKKGESKLSWNNVGPAGKNGSNGAAGKNGTNGANGTAGVPGAPGTALGYAKVSSAGVVEPGAKGVTSANVTKVGTAGYCFGGMSFTPAIAAANVAFVGSAADAFAQVELASADPNFVGDTGCPAGSTAFVFTVEGATAKPEPFYVLFS